MLFKLEETYKKITTGCKVRTKIFLKKWQLKSSSLKSEMSQKELLQHKCWYFDLLKGNLNFGYSDDFEARAQVRSAVLHVRRKRTKWTERKSGKKLANLNKAWLTKVSRGNF